MSGIALHTDWLCRLPRPTKTHCRFSVLTSSRRVPRHCEGPRPFFLTYSPSLRPALSQRLSTHPIFAFMAAMQVAAVRADFGDVYTNSRPPAQPRRCHVPTSIRSSFFGAAQQLPALQTCRPIHTSMPQKCFRVRACAQDGAGIDLNDISKSEVLWP